MITAMRSWKGKWPTWDFQSKPVWHLVLDPWGSRSLGWWWKDIGDCAICSTRKICSTVPSLCIVSFWTWLAWETLLTVNFRDSLVYSKDGFMLSKLWLSQPMECAQNHNNNDDENKINWMWLVYGLHPSKLAKASPWSQTSLCTLSSILP